MEKKNIWLIILIIILSLLFLGYGGYRLYTNIKSDNKNSSRKEELYEIESNVSLFADQNGNQIKIEADKLVTATGFSGASNYQYYLRGTTLYFRNTSDINLKEQILAYNINDIYIEDDYVVAEKLDKSEIITENDHVKYKDMITNNKYSKETQSGDKIEINADKLVTATGFSGASNYQYYLRGTTLYFRNTSDSNNKEEILAYNVKDIYLENNDVVAELLDNGNVIAYNQYINYINQNTHNYNKYYFTDQSGIQIEIEADKLVTATGFSGSSNYQYYLRETTLYFRNTSDINLDEQILAYNIKDLYLDGDQVIAVLDNQSSIITENNYIKYVD